MRLPHHPALPLISLALLTCLCGDIACALLERRFQPHPPPLPASLKRAPSQAGLSSELLALLGANHGTTGPGQGTTPQPEPPPPASAELPALVGTIEGRGQSLALLQSGPEPQVVAVGEAYRGLRLLEVTRFRARLRDQADREYTLFMDASPTLTPTIAPTPNNALPYKTSRELRTDLDNKDQWIQSILVKPVAQGVQIQYRQSNPFARLGIRNGDILVSLNSHPVQGIDNLPGLIGELRNAQTLIFQIQRDGQPITHTITLDP